MEDNLPDSDGATPEDQPSTGAIPDQPGAMPDQPAEPDGATPGEPEANNQQQQTGLEKALKAERDSRKALEKQIAELTESSSSQTAELTTKLQEQATELEGYRKRDAIEASLKEGLEIRRKANMTSDINLESAKALLMRLPLEEIPDATNDLLNASSPVKRPQVLKGQPLVGDWGNIDPPKDQSVQSLLQLNKVGGRSAVDAARQRNHK